MAIGAGTEFMCRCSSCGAGGGGGVGLKPDAGLL